MLLSLPDLVGADKALPIQPKWVEKDSTRVEFASVILISDAVVEGLELRGNALTTFPERGVCFNMQFHRPSQRCESLVRIEWNPLRPHTNPLKGPKELRGLKVEGSHIHRFKDNWLAEKGLMREKNLPFAAPIDPNPRSFDELLEFAEKAFRIGGLLGMEPPPWVEGTLFGD